MFAKEEYRSFLSELLPILDDTYTQDPTEDSVRSGACFFQNGRLPSTKDYTYFYHTDRLDAHKTQMLSMCKKLPKFCPATEQHSGIISSFDLLPVTEILETEDPQELFQQMIYSEHFANLLCGAGIATAHPITHEAGGEVIEGFVIILDKKYRSYL